MSTQSKKLLVLTAFAMAGPISTAMAQQCNPGTPNGWEGPLNDGEWDDPINWSEGEPGDSDDVVFTYPADTLMNLVNTFNWGRRVCSITVEQTGSGSIDLEDGQSRMLYLNGDLERAASVGDFTVKLRAIDAVFVGNPSAAFDPQLGDPIGSARGFCWDIDGTGIHEGEPTYALLSISDKLGCGSMTARNADIGVGYNPLGPEGQPHAFTDINVPGGHEGEGIVTTSYCGGVSGPEIPCTNESTWVLDSVNFRAKKCPLLGQWTVTETGDFPSSFRIRDYFRANLMTFSGTQNSRFYVGFTGNPANPLVEEGLRITNNELSIEGPMNDETLKGPRAIAEKLRVEPSTQLNLSDGVDFYVSPWWSENPADVQWNHTGNLLPVEAVFLGDSSLRYGPREGTDQDCYPPNTCQPITRFEVRDQGDHPRLPVLQFKDQSYITAIGVTPATPHNIGIFDEMELRLQVGLDVESTLSEPPASQWHTGYVDLAVLRPTNPIAQTCVAQGLSGNCEAEIEVFAADSCNVFFTDLKAQEPRTLKYWRSLRGSSAFGDVANIYVKLVDRHDNYKPELPPVNPCDPVPLAPEAMYVAGAVTVDEANPPPLFIDLNGHRLYYGSLDIANVFLSDPQNSEGPQAAQLIKTRWGDFNGDCYINSADEARFPLAGSWSGFPIPTRPAIIPIYDFDGDGLVGPTDYHEFYDNRLNNPQYQNIPGCSGSLAPWCPDGPPTWPAFAPVCIETHGRTIRVNSVPAGEEPVALKLFAGPGNPAAPCLPLYVQTDGTLGAEADTLLPEDWNSLFIRDGKLVPEEVYELKVEYGGQLSPVTSVTTSMWGDSDGDGDVDIDDILCLLAVFGGASYGNCNAQSADWVGAGNYCIPDAVIDIDDILAILDAFAGVPFSQLCTDPPCTPGPPAGSTGSGITLLLTASKTTINPGQTTTIYAFVRGPQNLRAYQTGITVSTIGTSSLMPQPMIVDTQRTDYVFLGTSAVNAVDDAQGRLTSGRYSGGTNVGTSRKYLGSFPLKASATGTGTFTISVNAAVSRLRKSDGQLLNWTPQGTIQITVINPP